MATTKIKDLIRDHSIWVMEDADGNFRPYIGLVPPEKAAENPPKGMKIYKQLLMVKNAPSPLRCYFGNTRE